MSYRELWVFIQHLPLDSWTQTILRDQRSDDLVNPQRQDEQKFGPWALINYQLAALTDAMNRVWHATAVGKFEKVEPLPPTPQPGRRQPKLGLSDEVVIYLEKFRAGPRLEAGGG